jgi:murein DD-endopeptidase MepM/ murein hydrolase activator NlpD
VAKLSDTIRVGDREIIKQRQFTRVTTPISLASPNVADEIPPYNPLKMATAAPATVQRAGDDQSGDATADVSMTKRSLSTEDGVSFSEAGLSDEEAMAQLPSGVSLQQPSASAELSLPTALMSHGLASPNVDSAVLGYAAQGVGPFSSIDVRVVPENVATITKLDERAPKLGGTERIIVAKHGDTFEQILRTNGATPDQLKQIQAILAPKTRDYQVATGQKLRLLVASDRATHKGDELLRVVIYGDEQINGIAAVDDNGVFRSVIPPTKVAKVSSAAPKGDDEEEDEDSGGPTLYEGLYETALKNSIPRATIDDLVRIFAYDVDFQRKAQQGDAFDILYVKDDENLDADRGDILYASLTTGDETRKLYRYQTKDDGQIDFFDDAGKSAKKFLLRKPIAGGRFSSSFGYRYHPILGYGRMHTGVDWADKVGTPIFAAGNGVVLKASWDSGYGNRIEIQHNNGWVTTYNHMSAYARGITPGTKVRQGQVIGFIGSTGLSTGAHLHYEVIINGNFVDPLKVKLPRGRELDGKMLVDFTRERQHDDELLGRMSDPAHVAQNAAN